MNIKLSAFKSRLKHSAKFEAETTEFLQNIERELGYPIAYAELNDYDCDLKLIFVQTGGSEGLFLEKPRQAARAVLPADERKQQQSCRFDGNTHLP